MDLEPVLLQLGNWTSNRGPLHLRLAAALRTSIQQGILPLGTRLPSERSLSQALALSRTTVVAAYNTLRAEGTLESHAGSGTWVPRNASPALRSSAGPLTGSPLINLLSVDAEAMVDFAVGTTVPLTALPRSLYCLNDSIQHALLSVRSYMPFGLPALREAIARLHSAEGLATDPDQILITTGAQQAIALTAALYLRPGDLVLTENPAYFGALDALRVAGARIAPVAVGPQHVCGQAVRDQAKLLNPGLIYLTPTHHNPTGAVMPEATRRALAELAAETGIPIAEDCALADLQIDSPAPAAIASFAPAAPIIGIHSISKLYWAGLRIGWLRAPAAVIHQLARLKTATDLGSPSITQVIAVQLLSAIGQARDLRRKQLADRRNLLAGLLRQHLPEWQFTVPPGGLYLWVRLQPQADARSFAHYAARFQVAVTPGNLFTSDDSHTGYLRIPFVLEESALTLGVQRLALAWQEFQGLAQIRSSRMQPLV